VSAAGSLAKSGAPSRNVGFRLTMPLISSMRTGSQSCRSDVVVRLAVVPVAPSTLSSAGGSSLVYFAGPPASQSTSTMATAISPTNFEQEGNANLVGPVKTGAYYFNNNGTPNVNIFANGPAAINSFAPAYAGQSGQRDVIRGDGFFGIDLGLAKRWTMPWSEKQSLQFRWEVFNVTNSVRFDVQSSLLSGALTLDSGQSFGNYSGLLTNPRNMQFALRYEF